MDNRELIIRALTDATFRRALSSDPVRALGVRSLTRLNRKEIDSILGKVRQIEGQIASLADELLCASGGPCGIA
jgi:hypothetical protein